ncbi:MAG: hypothetical protein AAF416_22440 [Pseudomonadota bacterium]
MGSRTAANGHVEGMVGFTRRSFMVPVPHARDEPRRAIGPSDDGE